MSMARLNVVQSARKSPGTCGKCQKVIQPGEKYIWWKFRQLGKRVRCADHPPEAWERESNSKRQDMMQAEEAYSLVESSETAEEAAGHLRDAIGFVESVKEQLESAIDGWESAQMTSHEMYQTFCDDRDSLGDWIDQAETWADDLEGWEEGDTADDLDPDKDPDDGSEPGWMSEIVGVMEEPPGLNF